MSIKDTNEIKLDFKMICHSLELVQMLLNWDIISERQTHAKEIQEDHSISSKVIFYI